LSGHSKWSKIKRQKGRNDKQKGRLFAKLGREIAVAARESGGDPGFNPRLRTAIDNAQAENMPNENIERAIQRGTGELPGVDYQEVTYEGYGPGGAALFMECVTDNANRTVQELRYLLERYDGNLGRDGSVAWMFDRVGEVWLDAGHYDEDVALEAALEAGADDMTRDGDAYRIQTSAARFHEVAEALRARGLEIRESGLAMVPKSTMRVEGRQAERLLELLSEIEDHDDVQKVWSNFEVDEEALAAMESAGS
jgi:YebC/PmpR family DNA-binding regulatory protein